MVVRKFNASNLEDIKNQISPFTIGFDRIFSNLHTVADLSNNYPPYNIVKDKDLYIIEFAAAGFEEEELTIHQIPDGNKLVIQGVQGKADEREFIHRGIGARNFTKTFALNDDIEVVGAEFTHGMLRITLEHIVPEEKKPKEIKISTKTFLQE